MKIFDMLKSGNKFEKVEGYCIVVLLAGSLMLSVGMGLTAISTKGISAILAMLGSLIAFLATIALIFTWLAKELFGE
jgi:uncharacterized protein (DUF697 family)